MLWRRRRDRDDAHELIEDCERFLAGRYVEHLAANGRRVPVWAWVNLLAHGTEPELRVAAAPRPPSVPVTDWERARSFLAGEVLAAAEDAGTGFRSVQRTTLVPLELELAADRSVERWRPNQLVAAVLAALPHRSERHHEWQ